MNKKITIELAIGVIFLIALFLGAYVLFSDNVVFRKRTSEAPISNQNIGMANPASINCEHNGGELEIRINSDGSQTGYCKFKDGSECEEWAFMRGECKSKPIINFMNIEFDGCGKQEKYNKLTWWNSFKNKVEQINFYTDSYIETEIRGVNENEYYNPEKKITYNYSTLCENKLFSTYDICVDGKNKKLQINNDEGNDLEGCLSEDGRIFVVIFPGVYMGGGNHIFRYDIKNNVLEEAIKVNEKFGNAWTAPPSKFLKRVDNLIRLKGGSGDAGCVSETEFVYSFIENTVQMKKECTGCSGENEKMQMDCKNL